MIIGWGLNGYENSLVREGGFALISGDPGTGKSVALRVLSERLSRIRDIQVGIITHPSTNLRDFVTVQTPPYNHS